jgi:3-isopropylmalate dehydratase small subunit
METKIVHQNRVRKWGHIRLLFKLLPILCILLYAGCAQVPKQSVELSATVGRDIAQVYKAHRELAVILYGRIKGDVNKFVDQVYAPYQIQKLLQADHEDFKKGDPDALFSALDVAIKQPKNSDAQKTAFQAMEVFVQVVHAEIESYREERLAPVLAQEKEVLSAIDRSYNQIHYANSIVTGHLASIVKVHDAQEDLLNEFGIEGLRKDIGQKLSSTSNSIAEFVKKAKRVDGTVEEMEEKIKKLTKKFDMLVGGKKKKEE